MKWNNRQSYTEKCHYFEGYNKRSSYQLQTM